MPTEPVAADSTPQAEAPQAASSARERVVSLGLALVMLLAVALRALNLGTQSMWLDELFSRGAALEPTLWATILRGSINDMFPPLYPLITHFAVRLPGDAEAAMRLPSAVAGAIAVFVVFSIGRVLHSARVGLVAAALVGCHWFAIAYSQEGRPYALLSLFSALAAYCGLYLVERQRRGAPIRRALLALGAAGFVLCFLHYVGALFFGAELLMLLAWARRDRASLRGILLCSGALGLAYLPWLSVVATQIGRREGTKRPPHLGDVIRTHSDLLARHPIWFWSIVALACWAAWRGAKPGHASSEASVFSSRERAFVLAAWAILPVAMTFALSYLVVPIYTPRNMIVALPALALAAALALREVERWLLKDLPLASLLIACGLLIDLLVIKRYYDERKEPWEQLVQHVVAGRDESDALWVRPAHQAGFVNQYLSLQGTDLRVAESERESGRARPDAIWILGRNVAPNPPTGYTQTRRWDHQPDRRLPWAGQPMWLIRYRRDLGAQR